MKLEESGCWNGCCSRWSSGDDDMLEGTKSGVERAQYAVDILLNSIKCTPKRQYAKAPSVLRINCYKEQEA